MPRPTTPQPPVPEWDEFDYLIQAEFDKKAARRVELKMLIEDQEAELKDLSLEIGAMLATANCKSVRFGHSNGQFWATRLSLRDAVINSAVSGGVCWIAHVPVRLRVPRALVAAELVAKYPWIAEAAIKLCIAVRHFSACVGLLCRRLSSHEKQHGCGAGGTPCACLHRQCAPLPHFRVVHT